MIVREAHIPLIKHILHIVQSKDFQIRNVHTAAFCVFNQATCHPSFSEKLANQEATGSTVVQDGQATTSRGPGTCFEFALSLVEQLYGKEKMDEISKPLV